MIRRNRKHWDLWALRQAWDDADFWTHAGEKLASWGAWSVIALAAILIVAGWMRLGG